MTQRLVTDSEWMESVLREAEVAHIALATGGAPYVLPVSFVYHDGHIYFHSSPDARKMDLVRQGAPVGLVAYIIDRRVTAAKPCSFGVRYRSVQASCTAREVSDPDAKRRALDALIAKEGGGARFASLTDSEVATVAVVELTPVEMMGKENA